MAYISRDPFARTELHRENDYLVGSGCAWCGGVRFTRPNKKHPVGRPYLYRFYRETDNGHRCYDGMAFCSKSCRDSYGL
jgi:hypothetical protein